MHVNITHIYWYSANVIITVKYEPRNFISIVHTIWSLGLFFNVIYFSNWKKKFMLKLDGALYLRGKTTTPDCQ